MMYTTNAIESINSQFKRISRSKAILPTDESLEKILYLVPQNISKKWIQEVRSWEKILRMLVIIYPEQIEKNM